MPQISFGVLCIWYVLRRLKRIQSFDIGGDIRCRNELVDRKKNLITEYWK